MWHVKVKDRLLKAPELLSKEANSCSYGMFLSVSYIQSLDDSASAYCHCLCPSNDLSVSTEVTNTLVISTTQESVSLAFILWALIKIIFIVMKLHDNRKRKLYMQITHLLFYTLYWNARSDNRQWEVTGCCCWKKDVNLWCCNVCRFYFSTVSSPFCVVFTV